MCLRVVRILVFRTTTPTGMEHVNLTSYFKISLYSGEVKKQKRVFCTPENSLKRFIRMEVIELKDSGL